MLDFLTLSFKREITQDNEKLLDLTQSIFIKGSKIRIERVVTLTDEFEGRPAYLSKVLLKTENYADLLMSINGISDPLSLQAGTIILVPEIQSLLAALKDNNQIADNNLQKTNVAKAELNKKYNNVDPQRTSVNTAPQEIRTPNMVKDGSTPVVITDGSITLGTNVSDTRCKTKLSNAQTRTEIIRKSVKEKILEQAINNVLSSNKPVQLFLKPDEKLQNITISSRSASI